MNRAALVFGLGASDAHAVNRNALYAVLYHPVCARHREECPVINIIRAPAALEAVAGAEKKNIARLYNVSIFFKMLGSNCGMLRQIKQVDGNRFTNETVMGYCAASMPSTK